MRSSYGGEANWQLMATIEAAEPCPDLAGLIADLSREFQLQRADQAPRGYAWFNLLVDASRGERRCARTTYALLTAMQRIAEDGGIPDFRIVHGEQWLLLGTQDKGDQDESVLSVA